MQDYLSKIKLYYEKIRAVKDFIFNSSFQVKVLGNLIIAYYHFKPTFYLITTETNKRSFDDFSRILISEKYLKKKFRLDIKGKNKVTGFVKTN
jgi:hypothetical protein